MSPTADLSALGRWIQPQHLDETALAGYREAFASHPARLIWLRDFLVEGVAERLSTFLVKEAQFATEYGLYSVEGPVPEDVWVAAGEDDRFFRLSKIAGTAPEFRLSPNAMTYVQFRQAFQGPLQAFFEALSGLALGPSKDFGSHRMEVGDFLRPHSDDNRNRQIALVIYLSPGWDPSAGGALEVRDAAGGVHCIDPEYNSVVAFDVLADTVHQVPVLPDAAEDRPRLTIGGWYPCPT